MTADARRSTARCVGNDEWKAIPFGAHRTVRQATYRGLYWFLIRNTTNWISERVFMYRWWFITLSKRISSSENMTQNNSKLKQKLWWGINLRASENRITTFRRNRLSVEIRAFSAIYIVNNMLDSNQNESLTRLGHRETSTYSTRERIHQKRGFSEWMHRLREQIFCLNTNTQQAFPRNIEKNQNYHDSFLESRCKQRMKKSTRQWRDT